MSARRSTVAAGFIAFDMAISLDPADRRRAEDRAREVCQVLVSAGVAASTFGQGSFARKTMRKPLKDVDLVVLLSPGLKPFATAGPGWAMDSFKQPLIGAFGPRTTVRFDATARASKALQVVFGDCEFTFDLVAAYPDPDGGEGVFIANRDSRQWEPSNTRTLNRVVSARNQLTGGRFVHQVREIKEFKAHEPGLNVCGLVIESLAYAAITRNVPDAQAVAETLRYGATAVLGRVSDPTDVEDLSVDWTATQRQTFAAVFEESARRAEEALRLDRARADRDEKAALDIWRGLLGEDFPGPPALTVAESLPGLAAGSITSTGRVTVSRAGLQPTRPTRAWRSS